MGATIFYSGQAASRKKKEECISKIVSYSVRHNWNYEFIDIDGKKGINLLIHERCEPVSILFTGDFEFNGFTKTEYAPPSVHKEIIHLFIDLKKSLKKVKLIEDTGYWDDLINPVTKIKQLEIDSISFRNDIMKIIKEQDNRYSNDDQWFWKTDYKYSKLHIPTILSFMRYELSTISDKYVSIQNIYDETETSLLYKEVFNNDFPEEALIFITEVWASKKQKIKVTKAKKNACIEFAWSIAYACFGYNGGFFSQTHRQAHELIDGMGDIKQSPENSLKYLLAIYKYYELDN
ncbi:hypothetical protein [Cohnella soli]|uniref:DUF4435 domain-containing protein n=1 Tax=Cohnella soli TaxID=425005 RepID=A0ABW0HS20_9BACL